MRDLTRLTIAVLPILLAAGLPIASVPAAAEHEPYHRFRVFGRVLHPDGTGVCNAQVVAHIPGYPAGTDKNRSVRTDAEGNYGIQLHVHDGEVGQPVTVYVVGGAAAETTTMDFVTLDRETTRMKRVELTVPASFKPDCPNILLDVSLWVGVPLAVIGALALVVTRLRALGPAGTPLTELSGLGRATEEELGKLGTRNVEQLAEADPKRVADNTDLTYRQAKKLIRRAGKLI